MDRLRRAFACNLTLAVLAAASFAQGGAAARAAAPPTLSVLRASHGISRIDGELWALGPDYKARIDARGVEFTPALGSGAPRNFPLALALESIRRTEAVSIDLGAAPRRGAEDADDDTALYERAPGITERYEARVDGLEQSFVFAQRPRGDGDLVVRLRVASELAAPLGEHETLAFTTPRWGGVRIGAVTGVDANGATAPGRLRHDGAALELVLPAAFVDAAAYPLVLDPSIGTSFFVANTASNESVPDVAYADGSQRYLVVWKRHTSTIDGDIYGQLVNTVGTLTGNTIALETSASVNATNPSAAYVVASSRFLVAWQQQAGAADLDVHARSVVMPGGTTSSATPIFSVVAAAERDPVVCGERTQSTDEAYVVCKRDGTGIAGARVLVAVGAAPVLITSQNLVTDNNAFRPTIAKSFGDTGHALVVYSYNFGGGDIDLYALLVNHNGATVVQTTPFATTLDGEWDPALDGDGANFIVAYTHVPLPSGSGDAEIKVRRVTHTAPTLTMGPLIPLTNDLLDQRLPAVAWTPGKAFVAWEHGTTSATNYDVYAYGIGTSDCKLCEILFPFDLSATWDAAPSMASQYAGGSAGDQVFATWYSGVLGSGLEQTNVKGQLLEAFGPGGAVVDLGGACGNGGVTELASPLTAGNPEFAIRLSPAIAPATVAFLFISAAATPFTCGTCAVALGGAQFPVPVIPATEVKKVLPIPCDANIVGIQVDAQWVVFPSSVSPCPIFGSASASNRLRLTVGS
ncbi:MAG: hypothetical protein EPO68_12765 [Planctomycetota bacterium]|nr:MAG: hypothetical protein EPO68_12765 [Planctomycetota bacterium]